jgi:hypothetical protein
VVVFRSANLLNKVVFISANLLSRYLSQLTYRAGLTLCIEATALFEQLFLLMFVSSSEHFSFSIWEDGWIFSPMVLPTAANVAKSERGWLNASMDNWAAENFICIELSQFRHCNMNSCKYTVHTYTLVLTVQKAKGNWRRTKAVTKGFFPFT